jgi:mannose-6-phosphate isomerase-like protein (cupin superfamily)
MRFHLVAQMKSRRETLMDIFDISTTPTKIETEHGEIIFELAGRTVGRRTANHSVAYAVIPPGKSSLPHFHPRAEESYYILSGKASVEIGSEVTIVLPGQLVLIPSSLPHNKGETDLTFLVACAPAWEVLDVVWLEGPHAQHDA